MKNFFRMSLVVMILMLTACGGEEKLYTHAEMIADPNLVDITMNRNARNPTDITAQNLANAKVWFPNKFANRKSNFSGIFKNSDQN